MIRLELTPAEEDVTLLATCFRAAILVAAILLLVAAGGCGSDGSTAESAMGSDGDGTVAIADFAYSPSSLTVDSGTTVSFPNRDSTSHTASANDGAFDTGTIEGGKSGSVTLEQPGTYRYYCLFHPFMKGTVTVE